MTDLEVDPTAAGKVVAGTAAGGGILYGILKWFARRQVHRIDELEKLIYAAATKEWVEERLDRAEDKHQEHMDKHYEQLSAQIAENRAMLAKLLSRG